MTTIFDLSYMVKKSIITQIAYRAYLSGMDCNMNRQIVFATFMQSILPEGYITPQLCWESGDDLDSSIHNYLTKGGT